MKTASLFLKGSLLSLHKQTVLHVPQCTYHLMGNRHMKIFYSCLSALGLGTVGKPHLPVSSFRWRAVQEGMDWASTSAALCGTSLISLIMQAFTFGYAQGFSAGGFLYGYHLGVLWELTRLKVSVTGPAQAVVCDCFWNSSLYMF